MFTGEVGPRSVAALKGANRLIAGGFGSSRLEIARTKPQVVEVEASRNET